jgi:hypothetical protein
MLIWQQNFMQVWSSNIATKNYHYGGGTAHTFLKTDGARFWGMVILVTYVFQKTLYAYSMILI